MDDSRLESRVARLETHNRRLRGALGGGAALVAVTVLAAMSFQDPSPSAEPLEVSELRVVDGGHVRIRLHVDGDAASVALHDPGGLRRASIVASPGAPARIELFDASGAPQPLLEQVGAEASALLREGAADLERELVEEIAPHIEGLRGVLDDFRREIQGRPAARPGVEMRIVVDSRTARVRLKEERQRLKDWLRGHPEAGDQPGAIDRFHALSAEAGGPLSRAIVWRPRIIRPLVDDSRHWDFALSGPAIGLAVPAFDDDDWNDGAVAGDRKYLIEYVPLESEGEFFTGKDIDAARVEESVDATGRPCVHYAMRADRVDDFAVWSEANLGRAAAIVLDGRVLCAPTFRSRIAGKAQISGNFTPSQIATIVAALRSTR